MLYRKEWVKLSCFRSLEVSPPRQQQKKDCCATFTFGSCHSFHHQMLRTEITFVHGLQVLFFLFIFLLPAFT